MVSQLDYSRQHVKSNTCSALCQLSSDSAGKCAQTSLETPLPSVTCAESPEVVYPDCQWESSSVHSQQRQVGQKVGKSQPDLVVY